MRPHPTWYEEHESTPTADRVLSAFSIAFEGREPDGVWAAPGRVNVIGEHVDYNRGLCLPFALQHRTFVAVGRREDNRVRIRSQQRPGAWDGHTEGISAGLRPHWVGYIAGVIYAMRASAFEVPGIDIIVDSEVPVGAGLSSSAALECAVALAIDDIAGFGLADDDAGRARLAAMCVRAENEIAGAPTGGLDQAAALRTQAGHAILLDCADFSTELVPLDAAAAGLVFLVIDTRVHHALSDGQYGSRRDQCASAAGVLGVQSLREVEEGGLEDALETLPNEEMRRLVRHVVTEVRRVRQAASSLANHNVDDLGPIMNASHRSLRDDFRVSCNELDLACDAALSAGALGARMTGGGFGGSAVALVRTGDVDMIARAVSSAFADAALQTPAFLQAIPSGPGARVR